MIDPNKYFDVLHKTIVTHTIKEIKNSEDVLIIIQDLKDPKSLFDFKNKPKYLTTEESKSEVNKAILAVRLRQYIEQEERLSLNMIKIYGIMWAQFTQVI